MELINKTNFAIDKSLEELKDEFPFLNSDFTLIVKKSEEIKLNFDKKSKEYTCSCQNQRDLYYLLHLLNAQGLEKDFSLSLGLKKVEDLSLMVDCSRNSVLKISTLKQLIRYIAYMGYDTLKLYMEDTYTIKGEPYFGYLRNGYSQSDLKQIDEYAALFDIEVVPCIQTLAHFTALNRWCVYRDLFDHDDILLVDEPEVYKLIDKMFSTLSSCFRSKRINIGMDEAYYLGRGKYLDKHGYKPRYEILLKHLKKVLEISSKYNYKIEMWSDMFFSYSQFAYQDSLDREMPKLDIPDNLKIVYWDYELRDDEYIDKIFKLHREITNNVTYAAGAWKWIGFAPNNGLSLEEIKRYMKRCEVNKIREVTITAWGDNGAECSIFSILPTLNFAGNTKYFGADIPFSSNFECLTQMEFESFLSIDRVNQIGENWSPLNRNYMCSTFLYNDPLLGIYDSTVRDDQSQIYQKVKLSLAKNTSNEKFGYIFKSLESLIDVLIHKCDFGLRLRSAYKAKDLNKLAKLESEVETIKVKLMSFYRDFSYQWHRESRSNGFDVQDLRIGGLKMRLEHTQSLLKDYLNNKIERIDELEETIRDFYGKDNDWNKPDDLCESSYKRISTVNINK